MSADLSDRFRQYRPRPLEILDTTLLATGLCTPDLGGVATTGQFTSAVCQHLAS